MTRFLLIAAVLAAGCEQLKTPKKLKELEGRVDELSAQVDRMATRAGASKPKADKPDGEPHDGSGDAAAAPKEGAGEAKADKPEAKEGDPKPEAKPDDKPEPSAAKPEPSAAKPEEKPEAKPDDPAAHAGDPADAGVDAMSKDDRALSDIAKLVASTTGKKKPAPDGDAKPASPDAKPAASDAKPDGKPEAKPEAKTDAKDPKPKPKKDAKDKPPTEWGYNAKIGPPLWATLDPAWRLCDQGKAQSPVDIEPRPGTASPIVFHYRPTPASIVDSGHTLEVDFGEGSWIEIADHTYQLVQLVFHTPSEHTIAGEHYPLEAQLVHKDSAGRVAMISVLYDAGAESRSLGGLWAKWPHKVGAPSKLPTFDPAGILPDTRTVFRYTGSLTTPPCTEGVTWNVMRRALSDSKAHLDAVTSHYKITAREPQPLGDRKIQ